MKRVDRATRCLVNRERAKLHLRTLRSRPVLTRAARTFAAQLVRERFFDHTAPNGRTLLDRIRATSYLKGPIRRWGVGENIAYGTEELATPEAIVGAWMRSAGHRHNILDPRFAEAGLGVTLGPGGATFVQDRRARSLTARPWLERLTEAPEHRRARRPDARSLPRRPGVRRGAAGLPRPA